MLLDRRLVQDVAEEPVFFCLGGKALVTRAVYSKQRRREPVDGYTLVLCGETKRTRAPRNAAHQVAVGVKTQCID